MTILLALLNKVWLLLHGQPVLPCRLQCGYLSTPSAIMHPVSWTDMNMDDLGENQDPPKKYSFKFEAGKTDRYCLFFTT